MNSNQDCHFFLKDTCRKGDECKFRHSASAKNTTEECPVWKIDQSCALIDCGYRHSSINKKETAKPCYYETTPSGCSRPDCPFLHQKPRAFPPGAGPSATSEPLQQQQPLANSSVPGQAGTHHSTDSNAFKKNVFNPSAKPFAPKFGNQNGIVGSTAVDSGFHNENTVSSQRPRSTSDVAPLANSQQDNSMDVEVPTPPPASRTNQVTSNPPNILKPQIKTKTSVFGTANGLPFNQKSLKEVQMNSKPHSSPLMKPSSDDNTESDVIEKTLKRYNLMTDDQPKPKKVALNGRRMNTIAKKPISGATVGANGSATSSNPPSPPKNDLSLPQVNAKQNNNTGKATIATKQQATKPTLTKPAKAPVDAPLPKIRSFQEIMRAKRAGEFRQNGQTSASEQKTPSPPQAPVDTPPAKSAANVSQGLAKAKTVEPVSQNNKESNHLSVSNQPNYNQGALNNNQQPSLISQPVATTSQTTQLSKSPVLLSESKNSLVAQQPVRPATTSPKQSSKALSASSTESTNSNLSIHNTDANKETDTPTTSTVLIDLTKRNQEPAMPQTLSTSSSKPTQPVPSTPLRKPEVVPTFSTPRTEEFRRFNLQFEEEMKALRNNLPFSGPLSFENAHGTTHRDTVYYELQEQFARDMAALRSKSPLN